VVPESRSYVHNDEGVDDMPAHIRTALTSQTMSLSVQEGRLVLGNLAGHLPMGAPQCPASTNGGLSFDG
jgi:hypothetical protein